jgi:cytochrome c oxidase subunit 2
LSPEVMAMGGALLAIAGGRGGESLSIFDPASPPAQSIVNLSILVLAITGFIFLVVEGVFIYAIIRFRRGALASPAEPPQVYGSKPIEIAWTAAPALVVFILVLVTTRTLWEVSPTLPLPRSGDNALFVTVIGRQWWWEYIYEKYDGQTVGFSTANELHVPAGAGGIQRPVYLTLKSADVAHSFWAPRLAGKIDLIPGKTNSLWFQTDQAGLYLGQCAEYCGMQHANMLIRVVAEPAAEFDRWLEAQARPARDDPAGRDGRAAFLAQSCVNCHRVRGTPAAGGYAPDLTHLMSRQTLAAGMAPNSPENLRRWVTDPQTVKPGCLMPAFGLSPSDLDRIVGYLLTLR